MGGDFELTSVSKKPEQQSSLADFSSHAMDSFKYSLVQAPASGLVQLLDKATGTNHLEHVQMFKAPEQAQIGTSAWVGNVVGSTAASMIHFAALHRLVGTGSAARLEMTAGYGLHNATPHIAKSMVTGFAFGTLLSPVENELQGGDFWRAKLAHGTTSAATFGVLTAGAIGLRSTGSRFWSNDIVANGAAGLPAGIVDADLRSLLTKGQLSSWGERIESVANMTAGGALAGAANIAHEKLSPTTGVRGVRTLKEMTELADSTKSPDHPKRWQFDADQVRLPRADDIIAETPPEWYHRATAEVRKSIEHSQMPVEQRKLLVSGLQEMAYGLEAIASRPNGQRPIMTIYGSARVKPGTFEYELVRYLAGRAVQLGYDVQTGGGPGIMEAGNRGAYEALRARYDAQGRVVGYDGSSIGIVIRLPWEDGGTNGVGNGYQTLSVVARNFYTRAEMLNQAGPNGVFVVGPGGLGTGAEGLNTLTQLQTQKMAPAPVFFLGRSWRPLDTQFRVWEKAGMTSTHDRGMYRIVGDPRDILSSIPHPAEANPKTAPAEVTPSRASQ